MAIGIEPVLSLLWAARDMKFVFIKHYRHFMRFDLHADGCEMIGVLAIQQDIPGIAGAGLIEERGRPLRVEFGRI